MKSLSVLVADHHPLFAEGIRAVLLASGSLLSCNVTAIARTSEQVEGFLNEYKTDILLIDPNLPMLETSGLILNIKAQYPNLRIVYIASANDPVIVQRMLKDGTDGYLLKTTSKDELRNAIREVSEGNTYIGRGVSSIPSESKLPTVTSTAQEQGFAQRYHLTKREIEIIKYIGQALNNKEIGERLYISDQTVSVHRKNIMRKLKVNSTASMVKMVFENQLPIGNI